MNPQEENVLRIGISTLDGIEEKIKAFLAMNLNARKKRYLVSRADVLNDGRKFILKKGDEIDVAKAKLLRRSFKGNHTFKTFQPDEGIVLVSDMSSRGGLGLSVDLVTQVMNIGRGAYEAFVDRVDSFSELYRLFQKNLFPKLVIVGYLPLESLDRERNMYNTISKEDPYIRFMEVIHSVFKPTAVLSELKRVQISTEDPNSWKRFIQETIQEYKKPYFV